MDLLRVPEQEIVRVELSDAAEASLAAAEAARAPLQRAISEGWDISAPHREKIRETLRAISVYEDAIRLGYEPTTLPENWYGGFMRKLPNGVLNRSGNLLPEHRWPSKNSYDRWGLAALLFQAPVPKEAMEKYRTAVRVFGDKNIQVYSPERSDFSEVPRPLPIDPVIIASTGWSPKGHTPYFEVARWDTDKDIAAVYKALS